MQPDEKSSIDEQTVQLRVVAGKLNDIAAFQRADRRLRRLVTALIVTGVVAFIILSLQVRGVTRNTNRAVRGEVPGLQAQIATRDKQIAELSDVNAQAVGHVVRLAKQVQSLGGDPGLIEIRPTTTTTTTAPRG